MALPILISEGGSRMRALLADGKASRSEGGSPDEGIAG